MPSRHTDARFRVARRVAGFLLALVIVATGWTHGVLSVQGGSMEPALHAGDLVVYQRRSARVRAGDMVLFEHGDALVVHRVAAVLRDGRLRTYGDANRSLDVDPVEPQSVRGRIVAVVPTGALVARLAALRE
jgi:signal peptidase I